MTEEAVTEEAVIAGTPATLGMVTNLNTVAGAGCEAPLLVQASYTFIKPEPGGVRKMWIVREAQ